MQRYFHFYTLTLGAYNSQRGNNEVPKFSKSINNFDNLSNHTRIKLVRRGSAFYLIKNLARNLYHVKFDTLCVFAEQRGALALEYGIPLPQK